MVQIKSNSERDLDEISKEHFEKLRNSLLGKINSLRGYSWLKHFLKNNLYTIITGSPVDLIKVNKQFYACLKINSSKPGPILDKVSNIFSYDRFSRNKETIFNLANKLHMNTCPYCNRNYTVTVQAGRRGIVRPDFDHFFPKSGYPLLALSFYNLIPSCPICNRAIKGSKKIIHGKYVHPYEEGFGENLKFNFVANDTESMLGIKRNLEIDVILRGDVNKIRRCKNSFLLFKLKEIYEASHLDEIADIIRKHHISAGGYLEVLQKEFKNLGTLDELYKVGFANYYQEDDFQKKPLAKLTKDIFEQLNFVMPVNLTH